MNKKEILKFLQNNELNIQNANAAFFAADMVFDAYANSDSLIRVNFSPVFSYFSYTKNAKRGLAPFLQIIPDKNIEEIGKKTYADFLKDPKSLDKKRVLRIKIESDLEEVWNLYSTSRESITNEMALEIFEKMLEISTIWWYYGAIEEGKGRSIEVGPVLSYAKRHKISIGKASEIISTLSHPDEPSVFTIERQSFFAICNYILKNRRLADLLKNDNFSEMIADSKLVDMLDLYISRYFWFKTDFYAAKVITRENLLEDISRETKDKSQDDIEKEILKSENDLAEVKKRKAELLEKTIITEDDKNDIDFSSDIILWIDERKIGMMKQLYYIYRLFDDMVKKSKIDYHTFSLYTIDEIRNFLTEGKRVEKNIIDSRNEGIFIVWEKRRKMQIFSGEEAEELLDAAMHVKSEKEIKGQVASKGDKKTVQGIARIVLNPTKDIFNDGEILVTSMTRVEFVPLMKKARGIITNEGGIACHAAIVSRELGVPCIIGTKNATKILKDGNLIEMDLESGVVKVLK